MNSFMSQCEDSRNSQVVKGLYISIPMTKYSRVDWPNGKRREITVWYRKKKGSPKIVFTTNPDKQPCKVLGSYDITTNEYTPEETKTRKSQLDLHIDYIVQGFQKYGWRK